MLLDYHRIYVPYIYNILTNLKSLWSVSYEGSGFMFKCVWHRQLTISIRFLYYRPSSSRLLAGHENSLQLGQLRKSYMLLYHPGLTAATLFFRLPDYQIYWLQHLQNTATRILTCTMKFEHITLILHSLHWLPIANRTEFKILTLTEMCLHKQALDSISLWPRYTTLHRPQFEICRHTLFACAKNQT